MTEEERAKYAAEARKLANRRILKFNDGKGAILCSGCRKIIKTYPTQEEINDTEPMYCGKCQERQEIGEEIRELCREFHEELKDIDTGLEKDTKRIE